MVKSNKSNLKWNGPAIQRQVEARALRILRKAGAAARDAGEKVLLRELSDRMREPGRGRRHRGLPRRSAALREGDLPTRQSGRLIASLKAARERIRTLSDHSVLVTAGVRVGNDRLEAISARDAADAFNDLQLDQRLARKLRDAMVTAARESVAKQLK